MAKAKGCPISTEIDKAKASIKSCYERLESFEKALKLNNVPPDRRALLLQEINEVKKLVSFNEEQLQKLHKENFKTYIVAAFLFFCCFLLYGAYAVYFDI